MHVNISVNSIGLGKKILVGIIVHVFVKIVGI